MRLYLMRHGHALSADRDPNRPLSRRGQREADRASELMVERNVVADEIWHSDKARAAQTAQIVASKLGALDKCEQHKGLRPDDSVEELLWDIEPRQDEEEFGLVIVGHLPFLGILAHHLLKNSEPADPIDFNEATVLMLEYRKPKGWEYRWSVHPVIASDRAS